MYRLLFNNIIIEDMGERVYIPGQTKQQALTSLNVESFYVLHIRVRIVAN